MKKLLFLFFFFPIISLAASPTVVGTNTVYNPDSTGSQSFSHTVPSGNENQCLIVIAEVGNSGNPTAITWNGSSMTKTWFGGGGSFEYIRIYYLANPDTGTHTIASTIDNPAGGRSAYLAFTLKDCIQSNPSDGSVFNSNDAGATSITNTISPAPASDSLTIQYVILTDNPSNATGVTYNNGQTELQPTFLPYPTNRPSDDVYSSFEAGESVMTLTWTNNNKIESGSFAIKYLAPSGGGGDSTLYFSEATSTEILFFARNLYYIWITFLLTVFFIIFIYKYIYL